MDQLLNKEERLPAFKLTIVQYAIVAILLVLLSGLWRLQVIGAQNYRTLAEQNRIRKVPILAPRGKLFDREGRLLVDNYPSVSCFLIREPGRDLRADFPLISRGLHMTTEQLEGTLAHYAACSEVRAHPAQAGHHAGRGGVHRVPPRRAAGAGDHRRTAAALSAQWLCRQPDRLRRRSERRHVERPSLSPITSRAMWSESRAWSSPTTSCCAARTARRTSSSTATAGKWAFSAGNRRYPGRVSS